MAITIAGKLLEPFLQRHFTIYRYGEINCVVPPYKILITCVIARSNPRRLFLFYACGNAGHYQSTTTPNRDVLTPNRDVMSTKCVFSQNAKQARVLHRAHERLSIYAMIVMPGQTEILSQG